MAGPAMPERRSTLFGMRAPIAAALLLVVAWLPEAGAAGADLDVVPDAWGPLITLRDPGGGDVSPVHATLLPDGKVLVIGVSPDGTRSGLDLGGRSSFVLDPAAPDPPSAGLTVTPIEQPVELRALDIGPWTITDNLVCSGHSLLADGRFFSAGGTRAVAIEGTAEPLVVGLSYATVFDGATSTWSRVPEAMKAPGPENAPGARWYPTVTRLPDGRMLVTSGFDRVQPGPSINVSTEIFDPATGSWTVTSPLGQVPLDVINSDYSHVFTLPNPIGPFDTLTLGEPGVPVLGTSGSPAGWYVVPALRPGSEAFAAQRTANGGAWDFEQAPGHGSGSAMLPLRAVNGDRGYGNGAVLVAGGAKGTVHEQAIDVFDPITQQWRPTIATGTARHHPGTVVLPDGRMLIVNGHSADALVRRAMYVDPLDGFRVTRGQADGGEVRGYHSVSLLLPDGRVLVAGGRDVTTATSLEKPSYRYYYPHYMFLPRPRIVAAPTTLRFGEPFVVQSDTLPPADAVLIGLGSMTHSFDMNQRSVQLPIATVGTDDGITVSVVSAPAAPTSAPPGPYMLVLLDAQRVPSKAAMVMLG